MFLSIQGLMARVQREVSGGRAWQTVADLSRYHRIQASPGYRAAAQYVLERLRAAGLEACIHSYPADGETFFWTGGLSEEWAVEEATLDLLLPREAPQRLADFAACPISLVQRSAPFQGTVDVVAVGKGEAPEEYEGLDVAGKVVLVQGDVGRVYRQAVVRRGAVGILCDGMRPVPPVRERTDLPDARQYTSFWWDPGDAPRCFGFVLTPRQGDDLRRKLEEAQREEGAEPIRVRARVVSRLYPGAFEVVEAFLPGETAEEVILVAHLCHPRPSANDNASGAAALLEAAQTLAHLQAGGGLPALRRGVRFLWVPEMTGTYAYLATHEEAISQMVAGLNLDMVGESQEQCGSVFLIERPPEATPSFAPDLLERLREELFANGVSHTGTGRFPTFRHAVSTFSGGSDHYILSDPTVGVPSPMLIQWPDRYYHTSEDTPDRVDPAMLGRAATLAAGYGAFLAGAGAAEARWLGHEMMARFRIRLTRLGQELATEGLVLEEVEAMRKHWHRAQRRLDYVGKRHQAGLTTLQRLDDGLQEAIQGWQSESGAWVREEKERMARILREQAAISHLGEGAGLQARALDEWEEQAAGVVPCRLYRGPVDQHFFLRRLSEEDREAWDGLMASRKHQAFTLVPLAEYWADGQRTALDVADLAEMEAGTRDVELVVQFYRALEKAGLMELRPT